jgi:hypothetical protein
MSGIQLSTISLFADECRYRSRARKAPVRRKVRLDSSQLSQEVLSTHRRDSLQTASERTLLYECWAFALETGEAIGVLHERLRQHLDRDVALEILIGRARDLTHATNTDLVDDLVDAEASGRRPRP